MTFSSFKAVQALAAVATVSAVVGSVAAPAHALTFTITPGSTSPVIGATTIDFNSTPLGLNAVFNSGIASYTGGAFVNDPNVPNQYARPVGSTGNYLTLGPDPSQPSPTTINFSTALNYFGLLWGSEDTFNSISFFSGNTLIRTLTGNDIVPNPTGDQGPAGTAYVNFFATGTNYFDRIVLESSQFAFESDNHAYRAIPTPALLPGLVGFAVAALRKRRSDATEVVDAEA